MKTSKSNVFFSRLFYIVVIFTCGILLYIAYDQYKEDQRGQAIYEEIKRDLLIEIDIIYQNQVNFETGTWRRFYHKLEDSLNHPKYSLTLEEFQNIVPTSPFTDTDFYFKSAGWERAQLHPEFTKRLTPYQLYRLQEFYNYTQVTAGHYDHVNNVINRIFRGKYDPSIIENEYRHYGTFINEAFLLDIKRENILMYAESVYAGAFKEPLPEHFEELKAKFRKSKGQEFE